MPTTLDRQLTTRLLRLDAASRALLLELDSAPRDGQLHPLRALCVEIRAELDRIFANDSLPPT
jgi:hypothetical protein